MSVEEKNEYLNNLNINIDSIDSSVSKESIENTNNLYELLKSFCENIPYIENIFNEKYINENKIPIEKSKLISKKIINKISPVYDERFKEYLDYVKFEKGDTTMSRSSHILYDESIEDIYTIIHEFFHYYCGLNLYKNKNLSSNTKNILSILDEAKSIISEEIVTKLLKENIDDLNIEPAELDFHDYVRFYGERNMASLYIFMNNIHKILNQCNKNDTKLNLDIIESYFNNFDKNSIEYKTYKENIDGKFFNYLIQDSNAFNNPKYYSRYMHPTSYLISLDLMQNMNIENNDFSKFNELVEDIKNNEINKSINTEFIKNGKIDAINKSKYAEKLLKNKDIKFTNKKLKNIRKEKRTLLELKKDLTNQKKNSNEKIKVLSNTNGIFDIMLGAIITIITGLIIFMIISIK